MHPIEDHHNYFDLSDLVSLLAHGTVCLAVVVQMLCTIITQRNKLKINGGIHQNVRHFRLVIMYGIN